MQDGLDGLGFPKSSMITTGFPYGKIRSPTFKFLMGFDIDDSPSWPAAARSPKLLLGYIKPTYLIIRLLMSNLRSQNQAQGIFVNELTVIDVMDQIANFHFVTRASLQSLHNVRIQLRSGRFLPGLAHSSQISKDIVSAVYTRFLMLASPPAK